MESQKGSTAGSTEGSGAAAGADSDIGFSGRSGSHQSDTGDISDIGESISTGSPLNPPSSEECAASAGQNAMDALRDLFMKNISLAGSESEEEPKEKVKQVLEELTLKSVADYLLSDKCKNVIVMCGAGISTAAGIPDFRSPGSGLYDNLQKYNLPSPQAIFEINFFKSNPEPFFQLAKELLPGTFKPTLSHYFVKLLHDKEKLMRVYTQNIDILERISGIPDEKLIEAHGTFFTSHCINLDCKMKYSLEWMKEKILKSDGSVPRCESCKELVKPDIVFFGEALPVKFFAGMKNDFPDCDLLIIMGTSLAVQPFASLVDSVPATTPRLLINREKCGQGNPLMTLFGFGGGLDFDSEDKYRDVAYLGTCDDGCIELATLLGWKEELETIYKADHKRIDEDEKKFVASIADSPVYTGSSKNIVSPAAKTPAPAQKPKTSPPTPKSKTSPPTPKSKTSPPTPKSKTSPPTPKPKTSAPTPKPKTPSPSQKPAPKK